jgi:hypothetical protein
MGAGACIVNGERGGWLVRVGGDRGYRTSNVPTPKKKKKKKKKLFFKLKEKRKRRSQKEG